MRAKVLRNAKWIWGLYFFSFFGLMVTGCWMTNILVQMDREKQQASFQENIERDVRACLWKLESHLSQFISSENARPYSDYMQSPPQIPWNHPWIAFHFQINQHGELLSEEDASPRQLSPELCQILWSKKSLAFSASAQSPLNNTSTNTDSTPEQALPTTASSFASASGPQARRPLKPVTQEQSPVQQSLQLNDFAYDNSRLAEQLEQLETSPQKVSTENKGQEEQNLNDYLDRARVAKQAYTKVNSNSSSSSSWSFSKIFSSRSAEPEMEGRGVSDLQRSQSKEAEPLYDKSEARSKSVQQKNLHVPSYPNEPLFPAHNETSTVVYEGIFKPFVIEGQLFLLRQIQRGAEQWLQGLSVQQEQMEQWMCNEVSQLFPKATFKVVDRIPDHFESRALVTLPFLIDPQQQLLSLHLDQRTLLTLFSLWFSILGAAVLLFILIHSMLALSAKKGAFASAVTHELRTPLTTFQMYAEMLDEGMVKDEEKIKRYYKTLRTESNRLANLVENVLTFSRLENKGQTQQYREMTLQELRSHILSRAQERVDSQQGKLMVHLNGLSGQKIKTDENLLEQILFNLVENACKYGREPDGSLNVNLEVSLHKKMLCFELSDTGPGVSIAFKKKLFEPFCKSDRDAANTASGVGLGLALCRQLAKQIGGELILWPSVKGATFRLRVPR
jgi:signal transduction histidine kinase